MSSQARSPLLELNGGGDTDNPLPDVRIIKDPIYDYMEIDSYICQFIDTPQFQRLRNIKQLGTSYYVWPGASHNRFEHCLGVGHLARVMVDHLAANQPSLKITERDRQCVQLAGLLHDLGHGPFSHVFDGQFIPRAKPGATWKHEDASELMFEALIHESDILIDRWDMDFVKDLIAGVDRHPDHHEKPFLFQIVANKQNGIDVDKFDYIARDTHAIGDKCNLAALRLIKSSRVIAGHIAYSNKDITNVFLLFQERWSLHKRVYTHPAAKAIEYMVVDALLAADPVLDISSQIYDPARFVFLTDSIIEDIERSPSKDLQVAKSILGRIKRRKLYKCVDLVYLPAAVQELWKDTVTALNIAKHANQLQSKGVEADKAGRQVKEEDIIVDWTYVHFGMKDKNPVDLVFFYGKHEPNKGYHARPEEYSQTCPHDFSEVALRIFTRDTSLHGLIHAGFRSVQQSNNLCSSENIAKTPLLNHKSLTESTSAPGSAGKLYTGNPFTVVPPSYTGSPRVKTKSGHSLDTSPTSSSVILTPPTGVLGITTGANVRRRNWETESLERDGANKRARLG